MTTPMKPRLTDEERVREWTQRLVDGGGYTADAAKLITDFAQKARSFEVDQRGNLKHAGGIVVSMFIRLGYRLQAADSLCEDDVDSAVTALLKYFGDKPLGDTVAEWRSKYTSNGVQRNAIDAYFGFAGRKARDLSSSEAMLFNVRDAAWPSRKEEASGHGGTFAERFAIFAKAVARLCTVANDSPGVLFGNFFHDPVEKLPEWITTSADGKMTCSECGSEIGLDSAGNRICTNPLCDYNIAGAASPLPASFMAAPQAAPRQDRPQSSDRRHHDDDNDDMAKLAKKHNKPKGPRMRVLDDDGDEPTSPRVQDSPSVAPSVASTPGAEGLGNLASAFEAALKK